MSSDSLPDGASSRERASSGGGAHRHTRNTGGDVYGAIEAGGTKFICAVARSHDEVLEQTRIDTTGPEHTISQCLEFFRSAFSRTGPPRSFGIASFGALDPDRNSPTYGYITETPKTAWRHTDLVGPFAEEFHVPVGFDTDVNAAALAEHRWGAVSGSSLVYFTVGTGIGAGAVSDGTLVHGMVHPEMGHIRPARAPGDTDFEGICAYHGDCLEGLAAGPAVEARWGASAEQLPETHRAWDIEAFYLAQAVVVATATLSPHVVVLGGGVMKVPGLIEKVRVAASRQMAGYFPPVWKTGDLTSYVRLPALGDASGASGAVALAMSEA
ncbi:MAG: ROK family protein, partial [Spirochaetota bacterium]